MTILCSPDYAIAFDWSFQFVDWGDPRARAWSRAGSGPARRASRLQAAREDGTALRAGAWSAIEPSRKEDAPGRTFSIALVASAWLLATSLCLFLIT